MKMAYGPALAAEVAAGDQAALLQALACLAALWFELAGSRIHMRPHVGAANALPGGAAALLAPACDLYDLLALSPQGRQALLDFRHKPVFQDSICPS